ncbi:MAG: hypothetical protein R3B38_02485 [Patescibacteria group bacterium]
MKKVEDEYNEKVKFINELKAILADPKKIDQVVKDENNYILDKYGDERRSESATELLGTLMTWI